VIGKNGCGKSTLFDAFGFPEAGAQRLNPSAFGSVARVRELGSHSRF
jgi:ABC-type cobalamin/Fe3+-siderophores transport system ATPase subunit